MGDSDSDIVVKPLTTPTELIRVFAPIKELGFHWSAFCCLCESEKALIFSHLKTSEEDKMSIRAAFINDRRRIALSREQWNHEISQHMKKLKGKSRPRCDDDIDNGNASEMKDVGQVMKKSGIIESGEATSNSGEVTSSHHHHRANETTVEKLFVGLENQGSTCYLNAMMQAFFHIPYFRSIIYGIDIRGATDPMDSIPLALQRLFYFMEAKLSNVSTKELTAAFGWDKEQAFVQHDVHELAKKLLEVLEEEICPSASLGKMVQGPISSLFAGTLINYTRCLDVDYTSKQPEVFYDLELPVKGHKDILSSLEALTKAEKIDGKYCWEKENGEKSYHEAERGAALRQLPPVLMVHPTRLDFDLRTLQRVTVATKWDFPEVLDLQPFTEVQMDTVAAGGDGSLHSGGSTMLERQKSLDAGDEGGSQEYILRTVIVHSGSAHAGHYYCYLRHDKSTWLKFNDENVTAVSAETVWKEGVGGVTTYRDTWGRQFERESATRASLLVYVNAHAYDRIVAPIPEAAIPAHLKQAGEEHKMLAETRSAHEKVMASSVKVSWLAEKADGSYATKLTERDWPADPFNKDLTVGEAKPLLEALTGIPKDQQRLWLYSTYWYWPYYRTVSTYGAMCIEKDQSKRPQDVGGHWHSNLFVQRVEPASPYPTSPLLLHVFSFGPEDENIVFQGTTSSLEEFQNKFFPVSDLQPPFITILDENNIKAAATRELVSGSVVILVANGWTVKDAEKKYQKAKFSEEIELMELLLDWSGQPIGMIRLPITMSIAEAQEEVFGWLAACREQGLTTLEPPTAEHVGLRGHDVNYGLPHKELKGLTTSLYGSTNTVKDILTCASVKLNQMYIEVLPHPLKELAKLKETIFYGGENHIKHFWIEDDSSYYYSRVTWEDLFARVRAANDLPADLELEYCETYSGTITVSTKHTASVRTASSYYYGYFTRAPTPIAEVSAKEQEKIIVYHASLSGSSTDTIGHAFRVFSAKGDTGRMLLERILFVMGVPDTKHEECFSTWKMILKDYFQGGGTEVKLEDPVYDLIHERMAGRCLVLRRPQRVAQAGATLKPKGGAGGIVRREAELKIKHRRREADATANDNDTHSPDSVTPPPEKESPTS